MQEIILQTNGVSDPRRKMAQTYYDERMYRDLSQALYDGSGFYNWGYWLEDTQSQQAACENLMEKLLELVPDKRGTILDVACGLGATTRHLLRYYDPEQVTGINISIKQLSQGQQNAPGCSFNAMDATHLAFADDSFDNMICVEAAFHFDTREEFLHEAHRVLKPGGSLVLSDVLIGQLPGRRRRHFPEANFNKDLDDYLAAYRRAGFSDLTVVDATKESWVGFRDHLLRWSYARLQENEISLSTFLKGTLWYLGATVAIKSYLLVAARKD